MDAVVFWMNTGWGTVVLLVVVGGLIGAARRPRNGPSARLVGALVGALIGGLAGGILFMLTGGGIWGS